MHKLHRHIRAEGPLSITSPRRHRRRCPPQRSAHASRSAAESSQAQRGQVMRATDGNLMRATPPTPWASQPYEWLAQPDEENWTLMTARSPAKRVGGPRCPTSLPPGQHDAPRPRAGGRSTGARSRSSCRSMSSTASSPVPLPEQHLALQSDRSCQGKSVSSRRPSRRSMAQIPQIGRRARDPSA